jgi:multidrug efflux pump subunit AcrA (membrane-fusion protein)
MKLFARLPTLIILVFILNFSTGCSQSASESEATPTAIPTPIIPSKPTYEVQRGEVVREFQFTGRIAPVVQDDVFFRADGRVRNVYVEKGDPVTEGMILADLEFLNNLERQYAQDQLTLRKAEIQAENAQFVLDLFKLTMDSPELQEALARQAVAEAELAVTQAERSYGITTSTASQSSIDAAYAQVVLAEEVLEKAKERFEPYAAKPEENITRARLQTQLSAAQQSYDAAVRLYNGLSGTTNPYEQNTALSALNSAKARLVDAQAKLELILSGVGNAQELALKENDVELAQIALEEVKLGIQDLEQNIFDARLTAPLDGIVYTLRIAPGRNATAYQVYAVVADITDLEIQSDLTATDISDLEVGMPVTAVLSNRPSETYSGYIRRLQKLSSSEASVEEDKSTRVALDVDPTEVGLEDGNLMRITVILEYKEDALWLPSQAIRTFEGRNFVVVKDGAVQMRVDIKIGIESSDRVEILEGLKEGQIVIAP